MTNPQLGPIGLDALASSANAETALKTALAQEKFPDYRQVVIVDADGGTAVHSGAQTLGIHSSAQATAPPSPATCSATKASSGRC